MDRGTKTPAKVRPQYAVPTDRMKIDTQIQALRTICTASRGGQEPVSGEKMATFMQVSPATAPLNNAFFAYLGLIEKVGKGLYKPMPVAMQFQQKWTFNPAEAPIILAPAFGTSWFYTAVTEKLEVSPTTTVDQMVEMLAMYAGTDNTYATQYGFCLDWLRYVGLITIDSNMVKLASTEVPAEPEPDADEEAMRLTEQSLRAAAGDEEAMEIHPDPEPTPQRPMLQPMRVEPPVVALSFELALTGADLALLSPEQIASFFEGFSKVAAIKAVLDKH